MVEVGGYALGEFIGQILISYMLVAMLLTQDLFIRIAAGHLWRSVAISAGIFAMLGIAIVVLYLFAIRIGTVMFVNGILLTVLIVRSRHMWGYWKGRGWKNVKN